MAEIINLSDDDEIVCEDKVACPLTDPVKSNRSFRCLNAECRTVEDLRKVSDTIRRYYGVLNYPKKTRACISCVAKFNLYQKRMCQSLTAGKFGLNDITMPVRDTVLLSDSDSDPEDNIKGSSSSEVEMSLSDSDGDDQSTGRKNKKLKLFLSDMIDSLGLKKVVDDSISNITNRLKQADKDYDELEKENKLIENTINNVRIDFYDSFKPVIRFLPALDCDTGVAGEDQIDVVETSVGYQAAYLPPIAPLIRPALTVGQPVFAMKFSLFSRWVPAHVVSVRSKDHNNTTYIVRYSRKMQHNQHCPLTGRQLAYELPCPTRLIVGTRVIAKYRDDLNNTNKPDASEISNFYVGIVAEVPTAANKYKYLIFFDDGYAQYVVHSDIRVVTEASAHPWEDVCSDSKEFIKEYVQMYPERPMVRLQKWNNVKTEWNGKWWRAQVMEVEGSLVKMYFPTDGRTEWIYRGSTRLSPLFHKKMSLQASAIQPTRLTARRRTFVPGRNQSNHVVEYGTFGQDNTLGDNLNAPPNSGPLDSLSALGLPIDLPMNLMKPPPLPQNLTPSFPLPNVPSPPRPVQPAPPLRSVAKKSTSGRPGTPPPELIEKIQQEKTGYIRKAQIPSINRTFRAHQCGPNCVGGSKGEELLKRNRNISPLLIPIVLGWRRQIVKMRKKSVVRKSIYYVAPCSRRLRNIDDLFIYLRITQSKLEIDFFSYELSIDVINEWAPHKDLFSLPDLSFGIEPMPISVVNSLDKEPPLPLKYCSVRKPAAEVPLNLDPEFLVCCSCTDNCQDKSRCECWQLTMESNNRMKRGLRLKDPGYVQRRLYEQVPTGIFECNSRCSCNHTCLNRVVQNPLRLKLQLFKTARRGWGVRTLHDVPRGSFLCVYVGQMITDTVANQEGKISGGDDYYAELDYIEVIEEMKEGYEEEAEDIEADDDNKKKKGTGYSDSDWGVSDKDNYSDGETSTPTLDKNDKDYKDYVYKNLKEREPSSRLQAKAKRKQSSDDSDHNSGAASPSEKTTEEISEDMEVEAEETTLSLPTQVIDDQKVGGREEAVPPTAGGATQAVPNLDDDVADENIRQRQNFNASINVPQSADKGSLRDYYGEDEQVYIMDAKRTGNIGRYLNHSCQPNVFVQNVFVDSQDLRFPYMSFFAVTCIRAGQELTWDYAYEVGSVAGKVKYCYCGARKCRGRLL